MAQSVAAEGKATKTVASAWKQGDISVGTVRGNLPGVEVHRTWRTHILLGPNAETTPWSPVGRNRSLLAESCRGHLRKVSEYHMPVASATPPYNTCLPSSLSMSSWVKLPGWCLRRDPGEPAEQAEQAWPLFIRSLLLTGFTSAPATVIANVSLRATRKKTGTKCLSPMGRSMGIVHHPCRISANLATPSYK